MLAPKVKLTIYQRVIDVLSNESAIDYQTFRSHMISLSGAEPSNISLNIAKNYVKESIVINESILPQNISKAISSALQAGTSQIKDQSLRIKLRSVILLALSDLLSDNHLLEDDVVEFIKSLQIDHFIDEDAHTISNVFIAHLKKLAAENVLPYQPKAIQSTRSINMEDENTLLAVYQWIIEHEIELNKESKEKYVEEEDLPALNETLRQLELIKNHLDNGDAVDFYQALKLQQLDKVSNEFKRACQVKPLARGMLEYYMLSHLSLHLKPSEDLKRLDNLFVIVAQHYECEKSGVPLKDISALHSFIFDNRDAVSQTKPYSLWLYALPNYLEVCLDKAKKGSSSDRAALNHDIPNKISELARRLIEHFTQPNQLERNIPAVDADTGNVSCDFLLSLDRTIALIKRFLCLPSANKSRLYEELNNQQQQLVLLKKYLSLKPRDQVIDDLFSYFSVVKARLSHLVYQEELCQEQWLKGLSIDNFKSLETFHTHFKHLHMRVGAGESISGKELLKQLTQTIFDCAIARMSQIEAVVPCNIVNGIDEKSIRKDYNKKLSTALSLKAEKRFQEMYDTQFNALDRSTSKSIHVRSTRKPPETIAIRLSDFASNMLLLKQFLSYLQANGCQQFNFTYDNDKEVQEKLFKELDLTLHYRFVRPIQGETIKVKEGETAQQKLMYMMDKFGAYESVRRFLVGETNDINFNETITKDIGFRECPLWIDFGFAFIEKRLEESLMPKGIGISTDIEDFFYGNVYPYIQSQSGFQALSTFYKEVLMQYCYESLYGAFITGDKLLAQEVAAKQVDNKIISLGQLEKAKKDQYYHFKTQLFNAATDVYAKAKPEKKEEIEAYILKPFRQAYARVWSILKIRFSRTLTAEEIKSLARNIELCKNICKEITSKTDIDKLSDQADFVETLSLFSDIDDINSSDFFQCLAAELPDLAPDSYATSISGANKHNLEFSNLIRLLKKRLQEGVKGIKSDLTKIRTLRECTGRIKNSAETIEGIKNKTRYWLYFYNTLHNRLSTDEKRQLEKVYQQLLSHFSDFFHFEVASIRTFINDADYPLLKQQRAREMDIGYLHQILELMNELFGQELHHSDFYCLNHELNMLQNGVRISGQSSSEHFMLPYLDRKVRSNGGNAVFFQQGIADDFCVKAERYLCVEARKNIELQVDAEIENVNTLSEALMTKTERFVTGQIKASLKLIYQHKVLARRLYHLSLENGASNQDSRDSLLQTYQKLDRMHIKAFLLKLKAHIELQAKGNTYHVGLQWLHGKQEIKVDGRLYAIPRRIKMQYDLINQYKDGNETDVLQKVLQIGERYKATLFSSKYAMSHHFTHFKLSVSDSEAKQVYISECLDLSASP